MPQDITLKINGITYEIHAEPETPLLYVLRNDLGIKGPKIACASENCGACNVLVERDPVPSCKLDVKSVDGLEITTIEGLGTPGELHPLQQSFIELQAMQCGYCTPGMIVTAQGLLNRTRYPTDDEIYTALENNLCRCGIYDRVRRAIKHRIGRPDPSQIFTIQTPPSDSDPQEDFTSTPQSLLNSPQIDSWIMLNLDETLTLFTGKVEYGQGIATALAQIVAEELDLSMDQIRVVMADTRKTPDEGITAGSMSMETSGNAVRLVAADARRHLLSIAHEELEAPLERLQIEEGVISDPVSSKKTSYWDLLGGKKFGFTYSGTSKPKPPKTYKIIGQPLQRIDAVAKVTGEPVFIQDLELPSMVHGRVVRPPSPGGQLISVDVNAVSEMQGVIKVVRDGSFLGVVAEDEFLAVRASEALKEKSVWKDGPELPDRCDYLATMDEQPHQSFVVVDGTPSSAPIPTMTQGQEGTTTISASYSRPFHLHAPLGPSAAIAQYQEGKLTVWSHSQGIFSLKRSIARVIGQDEDDVHAIYVEGPGCYGHTGADDAALDAAILAHATPGRPVAVKWTLSDEKKWEPFGPAMKIKMQASLTEDGDVVEWNHDIYSPPHLGRSRPDSQTSGLLGSWYLTNPWKPMELAPGMWTESGAHRNAHPQYDFPQTRVVKHSLESSPLRVSSLRSLGAFANVFAIESFVDELAWRANTDPLEFRLRHLSDKRAIAVLEAAAGQAGWPAVRSGEEDHGVGMAVAQYKNRASYVAVVVELSVNRNDGEINLLRAVIAADAGQIVNPDGLSNQLEGGFLQAASMALYEEVIFDRSGVTSEDWESYPILRTTNAPVIETVLINRPDRPFLGAGEGATGPTPAAIANAVFNAVGIRMRAIPFHPERVLHLLQNE